MSDLDTLWTQAAGSAKENFTTAALYLAIRHDPRPIVRLIESSAWLEAMALTMPDTVRPVLQRTHKWKPTSEIGHVPDARIDLVLEGWSQERREWEVWVEVKVDALESGNQLEKYELYWLAIHGEHPLPLVLLSPGPMKARRMMWGTGDIPVTQLRWSRVVDVASDQYDPPLDRSWTDLVQFLGEQWIAHRGGDGSPDGGADPILSVLWDLNVRMRAEYPEEGRTWWKNRTQMAQHVQSQLKKGKGLITTGANLVYGLRWTEAGWSWMVGADRAMSSSYGHITDGDIEERLEPLGPEWVRLQAGILCVEASRPLHTLPADRDAVEWLAMAIQTLRGAGLVLPATGVNARLG